jgi:hypothetical protein
MVEVATSALLEPPGIVSVHELAFGVDAQFACSALLLGRLPERCPVEKMIGATGTTEIDEVEPPHSIPQFST